MVAREVAVTFDGSFDGFLSVVYACYYDKIEPICIQDEADAQITIGFDSHFVETNHDNAARVFSAIRKKISWEASHRIYNAFLSSENDRFSNILGYIKRGFDVGHIVDSHLQEDCVRRVHKLANHVGREAHLLFGFCRFAETKQGVFYCKVTPKNNVLPLLAEYFSERFMNQNWVIHDKTRCMAAIYDGSSYVITNVPQGAVVEYAEGESEIQEQWVVFFNSLFIKARKNYKLQRQLLPLYFRKNMTEFQDRSSKRRK